MFDTLCKWLDNRKPRYVGSISGIGRWGSGRVDTVNVHLYETPKGVRSIVCEDEWREKILVDIPIVVWMNGGPLPSGTKILTAIKGN